nr:hypothetical protein [uncultured bacterium]
MTYVFLAGAGCTGPPAEFTLCQCTLRSICVIQ